MNNVQPVELLRRSTVQLRTGSGRSAIYSRIAVGLFPPPVKLFGSRAVGWPSNEVEAIVEAIVAGISEREMRSLVSQLVAGRKALTIAPVEAGGAKA